MNTNSNNYIRFEAEDIADDDIGLPFSVIDNMFLYLRMVLKIDIVFKNHLLANGYDETTIKKVLLVSSIMSNNRTSTNPNPSWCSKDANIMGLFAGMLLIYSKSSEKRIVKMMFDVIEEIENQGRSSEITEGEMKRVMDITMKLKDIFTLLENIDTTIKPRGSWINFDGMIVLKLSY